MYIGQINHTVFEGCFSREFSSANEFVTYFVPLQLMIKSYEKFGKNNFLFNAYKTFLYTFRGKDDMLNGKALSC